MTPPEEEKEEEVQLLLRGGGQRALEQGAPLCKLQWGGDMLYR
jgi:hypothetical protein